MINTYHENDRHCQECGLILIGRSDKKFCSDQCRASFHNREYSQNSESIRRVNRVLKRNRFVLGKLAEQGKFQINKKKLEEMGFNFDFYTHLRKKKDGSKVFYCYETGYLREEGDEFRIVRTELI